MFVEEEPNRVIASSMDSYAVEQVASGCRSLLANQLAMTRRSARANESSSSAAASVAYRQGVALGDGCGSAMSGASGVGLGDAGGRSPQSAIHASTQF